MALPVVVRTYRGPAADADGEYGRECRDAIAHGWRPVDFKREGDALVVTYERTDAPEHDADEPPAPLALWPPFVYGAILAAVILVALAVALRVSGA